MIDNRRLKQQQSIHLLLVAVLEMLILMHRQCILIHELHIHIHSVIGVDDDLAAAHMHVRNAAAAVNNVTVDDGVVNRAPHH